jgi:hypothetical protein
MCIVVSMCTNKNKDWFQNLKAHSSKSCISSIQLKEKCCLLKIKVELETLGQSYNLGHCTNPQCIREIHPELQGQVLHWLLPLI